MTRIRGIKALQNMVRVYLALIFSLLFSLIMSFYTPNLLGVIEFSYWQLFLFYAGYTGLLQLGLSDGIYLRYGAIKLNEFDKSLISGQLWILVLYLIFICLLGFIIVWIINPQVGNLFQILIFVSCYAVVYNAVGYCGYLLQAINQFKIYSYATIIDKLFLIITIVLAGLFNYKSYEFITILYILGTTITFSIYIIRRKDIFLHKFRISKALFYNIGQNVKSGINLMLSNIASSFIIGISRFLISIKFPIITFGYVSFSFTLCNFVLLFVSQIGIAIYPILKSKNEIFHQYFYPKINKLISYCIPFSLLAYPILNYIVQYYLPKYIESIYYFIYLLPICIFEAKISILYSAYMKVLRYERTMFLINVIASIFSIFISLIAILGFKNIIISLIGVGLAIMIKNLMYDYFLSKKIGGNFLLKNDFVLVILYYIFILFGLSANIAILIVIIFNLIYCIYNLREIISVLSIFKQ